MLVVGVYRPLCYPSGLSLELFCSESNPGTNRMQKNDRIQLKAGKGLSSDYEFAGRLEEASATCFRLAQDIILLAKKIQKGGSLFRGTKGLKNSLR